MKKLLFLLLIMLGSAVTSKAQISPQIQGAGAPSNPCANGGQQYVDTTNHVIYLCPSAGSNWVNIGAGNVQQPVQHGAGAPSPTACIQGILYTNDTTGDFYTCKAGTLTQLSGGGGGSAFPVTVSGTVTSGGIPCFNSTTNEQTSALLVTGSPVIGGGAGACPTTTTGTQFGILDWATTSTLGQACTPPATVGTFTLEYVLASAAAVQATCPQVGLAASTISGATSTYTVAAADTAAGLIVHDLAGSQNVAVTLPTPTTLANTNAIVTYENRSTHTDTITPTTWTIQLNGAAAGASATVAPGTRIQMLVDPFNATNWIATSFSLGGGGVFPQTVSGTVNSGGIPCFNSATNEQSSAAIGAGILIKGGGAGACAAASSITDNGTNVTSTDTGGFIAPVFVSNGTTAGFVDYPQGTTSAAVAPCNTATSICWQAPTSVTSYLGVFPSAAATGFPFWTNAANVITESILADPLIVAHGGSGAATFTVNGVLIGETAAAFHATAAGASNMPLIGQGAADPIFSTIAYPTTVTSGGACYGASTTAIACGAILNTNILTKGGGAATAPTNSSITDDAKNITTAEVLVAGNKVFVTGDFTDSTTNTLQIITGLSWTLPTSKAVNVSFHCALLFDQATAAVSDSFGIGVTGTAPTQANASGTVFTSASVEATGTLVALASTTPTAVVTFTPSAITTVWKAELDGTIEQPSNATPGVFNIYVSTSTGADNIIVKRGSYCSLF